MLKKHLIALGISTAILLLIISTFFYPGGSQIDKNAIGFDWGNNYLCNLFNEKAVNGFDNSAKWPAIVGMFFLCSSFAAFFIRFSKKISTKKDAHIIQYSGVGAMICAFFLVTSYHDVMTIFASTFGLLSLFYIIVFTFKSKLTFLKYWGVFCLIILYLNNYIYYTQNGLVWLPILQKISLLALIIWLLGLEYMATKEDFIF
jgi:hypothetical protein